MGLRATRVRTLDGYLVTVPNKTVGNNTVTNISRRPSIKTELNYGLTYETTAPRVRQALKILEEIFKTHPKTSDVIVTFDRMLDSSLNLKVIHWWGDLDGRVRVAPYRRIRWATALLARTCPISQCLGTPRGSSPASRPAAASAFEPPGRL